MTGRRWGLPILWALVILVATSIPNPSVGAVTFTGADKLVHAALYGTLGALAAHASWRPGATLRSMVPLLLAVLAFAALDEWHQSFIPGRAAEILDWVADAVGAVVGTSVVTVALMRKERYS